MSDTPDTGPDPGPVLHAQLAQRLFGWRYEADAGLWRDPDGVYRDGATFRRRLPAYSTNPAATAQVWQWLETHGMEDLSFHYDRPVEVGCQLSYASQATAYDFVFTVGATWPEALCRAALALAQALEEGEKGG